MSSQEAYAKEICDLLVIWNKLANGGTEWSCAKAALEYRINHLCRECGF